MATAVELAMGLAHGRTAPLLADTAAAVDVAIVADTGTSVSSAANASTDGIKEAFGSNSCSSSSSGNSGGGGAGLSSAVLNAPVQCSGGGGNYAGSKVNTRSKGESSSSNGGNSKGGGSGGNGGSGGSGGAATAGATSGGAWESKVAELLQPVPPPFALPTVLFFLV